MAIPPTTSALLWHLVSRLGEAQLLLPAMLAASVWLAWRGRAGRLAGLWLACTAAAAVLTTATKLAFLGWGIGHAGLDFTGISGHAMFAAAVLPPLLRLADDTPASRWQGGGTLIGYGLALLVAVSRVKLGAHSWSEVSAGFALGAAASGVALVASPMPRLRAWRGAAGLLALWAVLGVAAAPPSRTHGWVVSLALAASGRPLPYTRDQWLPARHAPRAAAPGAPPALSLQPH